MANSSLIEPEVTTSVAATATDLPVKVVAIWIDWYAYHIARFQGLVNHPDLARQVVGIELVGGVGVHPGLKFREDLPASLSVQTLLPAQSWHQAGKWKLARALWHRLNRLNPEVVLVPGYYTLPALAAAVWAKLKRRKSVLLTESTAYDHARSWWRESLKKLLICNLFDWAVAGGKPHRRYLQQLGFPTNRVASFYDVVDNTFFHDCCAQLRHSHHPADFDLPINYFLFVGRIAEEKNIDLLVKAYIEYRKSGGLFSLVIVGDGPQLKIIRDKADSSPFARAFYFPGLKSASELSKYYAFASAFVLPSYREPWGLVVNEAMASSLPVIVSNRCGCAEDLVRAAENGFTFDPSDCTALTNLLTSFSRLSVAARQEMGQRSFEIVSSFSPDAWACEIARIVNS